MIRRRGFVPVNGKNLMILDMKKGGGEKERSDERLGGRREGGREVGRLKVPYRSLHMAGQMSCCGPNASLDCATQSRRETSCAVFA